MLESIEIRNFQSLHHVKLTLDRFTVIVGASSSGKSALTRAIRTLTSNQRGHAFITHGERLTTITASTDKGIVTLKRGKTTADNEYVIVPSDPTKQQTFTKLAGEVPEEVSKFIGIPAKDPLNYAGQFDMPYLLKASPSQVAVTLGALTNVNVIFDAARESNRRKLAMASTLKLRATDLGIIMEKAEGYKPLKAQLAAMDRAEEALARATDLSVRVERLQGLTEAYSAAEEAIALHGPIASLVIPSDERIKTAENRLMRMHYFIEMIDVLTDDIERTKDLAHLDIPSDERIGAAHFRLLQFNNILRELKDTATERQQAAADRTAAEYAEQEFEAEYQARLRQAGTCPTCHQDTTHLENHHG